MPLSVVAIVLRCVVAISPEISIRPDYQLHRPLKTANITSYERQSNPQPSSNRFQHLLRSA